MSLIKRDSPLKSNHIRFFEVNPQRDLTYNKFGSVQRKGNSSIQTHLIGEEDSFYKKLISILDNSGGQV